MALPQGSARVRATLGWKLVNAFGVFCSHRYESQEPSFARSMTLEESVVRLLGSVRLRNQQQLTGRLSSFEVAMRLLSLGQRIPLVDLQFQFTTDNRLEHVTRAPFQFLSSRNVVCERRSRDEERTLLRKLDQIEWWHCAA